MKLILSAALVAMLFLSIPALAHHSFNTFFDMSKTVQIEGVVKSFKLIQPPFRDGRGSREGWPG